MRKKYGEILVPFDPNGKRLKGNSIRVKRTLSRERESQEMRNTSGLNSGGQGGIQIGGETMAGKGGIGGRF